jgi:hypothetical protein
MSSRRPRSSHASIVAQVAHLRRLHDEAPLRAAQSGLAAVLDGLNALDMLDRLRDSGLSKLLSGGPLAVQGTNPAPWVGAVIWQRAPGYFGYRTLALYGLWSLQTGDGIRLRAGVRHLAYALDFFEPDAYHKRIRREFAIYYADDGVPPLEDAATWVSPYRAEDRLTLRAEAAAALSGLVSQGSQ